MSLAKRGNLGENVTYQWKFSYRGGTRSNSFWVVFFLISQKLFYRKRSEVMHIFIEIASQLIKLPNYLSPILKGPQVYLERCANIQNGNLRWYLPWRGGVSRGSRVPHTYSEKWFFWKPFRIIPWLWKRVLHLVWALYYVYIVVEMTLNMAK